MANPLGLCQFYHTNPETLKSISAPKSPASVHRVKCLLEKAKDHGQPYIIVVFEGGNVTLLGLLQELHSQFTLSHIPIFTSDEAKQGQKTYVSCCPICAHISLKMIVHFLTTLSSLITGATLHVGNALMSSQHQASR